ncbi:unnamed protein product [Microthlaspi erraticum]|uniref:Reverse transcriptase Ty1/copia-type domain-containing protein n=1 Tax=Microthlaspi erraticum TaxID=1685480 RepID=A0A6D2IRG6_9BRAS|nr:unnamed protein product [Microthlaspi erraticum]
MKESFWVIQAIVQLSECSTSVQDHNGIGQCGFDDRSIAIMGDSQYFMNQKSAKQKQKQDEEVREVHEEFQSSTDDADWIISMEDELEEFVRNDVWELVPLPDGVNVVGTKWIFKNKTDDVGSIVRNKSRLVAQGYSQVEGVDFDETLPL